MTAQRRWKLLYRFQRWTRKHGRYQVGCQNCDWTAEGSFDHLAHELSVHLALFGHNLPGTMTVIERQEKGLGGGKPEPLSDGAI